MVDGRDRVLLVHPGGPFYKRRDAGVWSIPKGLADPGEAPLAAALRGQLEGLSLHEWPGCTRLQRALAVLDSDGPRRAPIIEFGAVA